MLQIIFIEMHTDIHRLYNIHIVLVFQKIYLNAFGE